MNGLAKCGAVLAGYGTAMLAASAAVAVRLQHTQGPDMQASAGMYALGDGLLFLAVFGAVAVLPTGMALHFLRPCPAFWTALSIAALALAATGIVAASVHVQVFSGILPVPAWESWAALGVLRLLAAPLLASAFGLSGCFAPTSVSRRALFVAGGIEGAVGMYAVLHWFVS